MASPHVAGVAARYLQANPTATPAAVAAALTQSATLGVVGNPGALSPNLLVWADPGPVTPPPPPPPVSITLSAKGTKVKGVNTATLTWTGATGSVPGHVHRDGDDGQDDRRHRRVILGERSARGRPRTRTRCANPRAFARTSSPSRSDSRGTPGVRPVKPAC